MSIKKKPTELKFAKESLLNSKRFHEQRDLISALLNDGAEYTISEVENMIKKYMKGTVK